MSRLRLGEKEQYEISDEMIEKYNLKKGTLSPFTRLKIIDIDDEPGSDIKEVSEEEGSDIKEVNMEKNSDIKEIELGSDIKEIDEGSDIKEIN